MTHTIQKKHAVRVVGAPRHNQHGDGHNMRCLCRSFSLVPLISSHQHTRTVIIRYCKQSPRSRCGISRLTLNAPRSLSEPCERHTPRLGAPLTLPLTADARVDAGSCGRPAGGSLQNQRLRCAVWTTRSAVPRQGGVHLPWDSATVGSPRSASACARPALTRRMRWWRGASSALGCLPHAAPS